MSIPENMKQITDLASLLIDNSKEVMENFEFKSQICTSVEQSKRLLELGLKKETADMEIEIFKGDNTISGYVSKGYWETEISDALIELIPAWSLHRLLLLLNCAYVELDANNPFEDCITRIEFLIKESKIFNKDYLEERK